MSKPIRRFAAALLTLSATAAFAGARAPTKAVPAALYSGRWYEIARTPNGQERGCVTATTDFSAFDGKNFSVVETCKRARGGKVVRAKATLLPSARNAKFKMGFVGGIIKQEYWILDTADGGGWAVMATPGGNYVWLLSRKSHLAEAEKSKALARIASLGYATAKLEMSSGT